MARVRPIDGLDAKRWIDAKEPCKIDEGSKFTNKTSDLDVLCLPRYEQATDRLIHKQRATAPRQ